MLHTVVPEEHHLSFGDCLAPLNDQFYYIIKVPKHVSIKEGTYLLLCLSFLGLMSSFLNQAK